MTRFFLGITGASGQIYARSLARALVQAGHDLDVAVTDSGLKVLRHELGFELSENDPKGLAEQLVGAEMAGRVRVFSSTQVEAPAASGTALGGGVVLAPCSVGTLGRVAYGLSSNLIERAADVAIKERRKLILVVREAPLSSLHLENMLRLSRAGAVILPASPGFYHRPKTLDDLVEHLCGKVLDALGVEHALAARWSGMAPAAADPELGPPGRAALERD